MKIKRAFQDITNVARKNIKITVHKSSHRKKLLKWLYEVINDFDYSQVTFASAVVIIDKYTERKGLDLSEYQLIGISALFISAKIEERYCKSILDYVHVTDNSYTKEEILKKEFDMINFIDMSIYQKLPHTYLRPWYIEKVSDKYNLKVRQEIFFSAFAYIMEKNTCGSNPNWIYLEGVKIAEKVLQGGEIDKDFNFYLVNNRKIDIF